MYLVKINPPDVSVVLLSSYTRAMRAGMFLLQMTSEASPMTSWWAGYGDENHKMFILIKLRYVNINVCFCFF